MHRCTEATQLEGRERPASGEEAPPAWAAGLQRELRAGLRHDLTEVVRELTGTKPDSIRPNRPAAESPGSGE